MKAILLAAAMIAGQAAFADGISIACAHMKIQGISSLNLSNGDDFGKKGVTGPNKAWGLQINGSDIKGATIEPVGTKVSVKSIKIVLPGGGADLMFDLKSDSQGFIYQPTKDGKFDSATNTGCSISID